jgi:hypothetical protein
MTKQMLLNIAAVLFIGLLALPAFAQSAAITVNIPFGFRMGNNSYPAGAYGFTTIREDVLVLTKDGRVNQGMSLANHLASQQWNDRRAEVRFQCYEQECFVSQVWIPGIDGGLELRRSRVEEELAAKTTGKYMALLATPRR